MRARDRSGPRAMEAHNKYITTMSGLTNEIAKAKTLHAMSIGAKSHSATLLLASTAGRLLEAAFRVRTETLRREGPAIGPLTDAIIYCSSEVMLSVALPDLSEEEQGITAHLAVLEAQAVEANALVRKAALHQVRDQAVTYWKQQFYAQQYLASAQAKPQSNGSNVVAQLALLPCLDKENTEGTVFNDSAKSTSGGPRSENGKDTSSTTNSILPTVARESGGGNELLSAQAKATGVLSNDADRGLSKPDAIPLASEAASMQVTEFTVQATEPNMSVLKAEQKGVQDDQITRKVSTSSRHAQETDGNVMGRNDGLHAQLPNAKEDQQRYNSPYPRDLTTVSGQKIASESKAPELSLSSGTKRSPLSSSALLFFSASFTRTPDECVPTSLLSDLQVPPAVAEEPKTASNVEDVRDEGGQISTRLDITTTVSESPRHERRLSVGAAKETE